MIAVPFSTSREYNSAPPTGIRLSFGVAIRSLSGEGVESEGQPGQPAAYEHASSVRISIGFMALKLRQAFA
jgi:hypothetical protein